MNDGPWVTSMSVGVPELDQGHKELFARVGEVVDALGRQSFEEAEQLCRSLIALGRQHAAEEEAFLRKIGYPRVAAVLEAQKTLGKQCQRLLTLITERSPDAREFADKTVGEMVAYLLRSDINFKSFVQEMRDLGRLK